MIPRLELILESAFPDDHDSNSNKNGIITSLAHLEPEWSRSPDLALAHLLGPARSGGHYPTFSIVDYTNTLI